MTQKLKNQGTVSFEKYYQLSPYRISYLIFIWLWRNLWTIYNGNLYFFVDRWQEKSLFLKLLVVDILTSACFAIGKFIFLCCKSSTTKKSILCLSWIGESKQINVIHNIVFKAFVSICTYTTNLILLDMDPKQLELQFHYQVIRSCNKGNMDKCNSNFCFYHSLQKWL